uniref:Uncharacterized protein n=1 Tax=Dulem virus 42 TaxID=3145760 RepID=A0AAU8BA68_9CAUD
MANAIDDVLRFGSLMTVGSDIYQSILPKNPDAIDFTLGGDIEVVRNHMNNLLFGKTEVNENGQYVTSKSIFDRVSELIDDIKHANRNDRIEKGYVNLVDGEGNILNDLLLYIQPISPNDKFPIGRMLLAESQYITKGTRKGRLIAAFGELLTSPNKEVRKLAEDLAFYAYFSTYDQNVSNSFFDLVPPRFRQQYDKALGYMISKARSKKEDEVIQMLSQISKSPLSGLLEDALINTTTTIIDVLSRNYWYDDNYVPRFRLPKEIALNARMREYEQGTYYPKKWHKAWEKSAEFPTHFATNKTNALYVKVVAINGDVLLYKKTGQIDRMKNSEKGPKKESSVNIYTPVHKAGIHQGKITQYELYCDYNTTSIFSTNRLYDTFAEDNVRKEVEDTVRKYNELDSKHRRYTYVLEWDVPEVSVPYTHDNIETYMKPNEV